MRHSRRQMHQREESERDKNLQMQKRKARKEQPERRKQNSRQAGRGEEKENKKGNAQILALTYCMVAVFLGMAGYLGYFMAVKSDKVINNPYNKRQEVLAKKVQRGEIRSKDGKVLAKTKTDSTGKDTRIYPYDEIFAPVVGRISNSMTGIEKQQCYPLLTSHVNPLRQLTNTLKGEKNPGDSVITTLDAKLQTIAYQALGNHKGAVVAIEPSTGKVLAMVSKPSYDPNTVAKNWSSLIKDSNDDSKLVNRATQGLYPPGSTFKVLTAMEYMIENPQTYRDFNYRCKGTDTVAGHVIHCYDNERHGILSLKNASAESCNGAFATLGTELDLDRFHKLAEKFGYNKALDADFEYNQSKFVLNKHSDNGELTQTAIGQGKTLVTPLQNALIAATIANDGKMMLPYVVDHVESDSGQVVKSYDPKEKGQVVDEWVAQKMNDMMKSVVTSGTGYSLKSFSYEVAGKTGSAEADSEGTTHSWFIGYAPADNPKIAISVVVEGAGTGSRYAVPVTKKMLQCYLGD